MRHRELLSRIMLELQLDKPSANKLLSNFYKIIFNALSEGNEISIPSIGVLTPTLTEYNIKKNNSTRLGISIIFTQEKYSAFNLLDNSPIKEVLLTLRKLPDNRSLDSELSSSPSTNGQSKNE